MIEKCLIEHCAPTLASLKAANLFNACCEEEENIDLQISMWNQLMNPKGVKLLALRSRGNRSLVYVYREKQLVRNLKDVYKRQAFESVPCPIKGVFAMGVFFSVNSRSSFAISG